MKAAIIATSIFITIIIVSITGGIWFMKEQHEKKEIKKEQAIQQIIKEEKPRIEKYFYYNYTNIKQITFTGGEISPMGYLHIHGYFNNNKNLDFSAEIYGKHFENSVGVPQEINEKYDKNKSVTEIEKEEKQQNKK